MCPPGISLEGCFINKVAWFMTLPQPGTKETRTIGKRSSPFTNLQSEHLFPTKQMDKLSQLLHDMRNRETNSHQLPNEFYSVLFDDGEVIPKVMSSQTEQYDDSEYPELLLQDSSENRDYLRYLFNKDTGLTMFESPSKKSYRSQNNKAKRQFSCRGDSYTCFLKNLQYILDIQQTMTHA